MTALKISGKVFLILVEFAIFLVLFFPYMLIILILQLIQGAIDKSHYKAKVKNTKSYEEDKRRALTDEKIDKDWDRQTSTVEYMKKYWVTLFGWIFE